MSLLELIQLTERVEQLEKIIAIQAEALEGYADPTNWSKMGHGAYEDIGATAREALAEVEKLKGQVSRII
jgi:hypothetical protein